MLDALAGLNLAQDLDFVVVQLERDDGGDGFADTSSAVYPNPRSAAAFQLVTMPVRSLLTMASLEDSTMARRVSSELRRRASR